MNENNVSALQREPVAITSALFAIVEAGIILFSVFGFINFTAEQTTAVLGFVSVVFALFNLVFVRSKVTPVADPRDDQGRTLRSTVSAGS